MIAGKGTANADDFGLDVDTPFYVESLRVYRQWGLTGACLSGLAYSVIWAGDGWQTAECFARGLNSCRTAPAAACRCGFYGWYKPDRIWEYSAPVWGAVEVAGTCVLGSLGLRAERMRPLGLVMEQTYEACPCGCGNKAYGVGGGGVTEQQRLVLAERTGVPVFETRDELVERFPMSDWESMVGPIEEYSEEGDGPLPDGSAYARAVFSGRWVPLPGGAPSGIPAASAAQGFQRALKKLADAIEDTEKRQALQAALEAKKARQPGPAWLRDPFRRGGRGGRP